MLIIWVTEREHVKGFAVMTRNYGAAIFSVMQHKILSVRTETIKLTGETDPKKAAVVLSKYLDKVIVKLDSEGCLIYHDGEYIFVTVI